MVPLLAKPSFYCMRTLGLAGTRSAFDIPPPAPRFPLSPAPGMGGLVKPAPTSVSLAYLEQNVEP